MNRTDILLCVILGCAFIVGVAYFTPEEKHSIAPESFIQAGKLDSERSGKWHTLRNKIIKAHPYCAFCGNENKLQAHHIKPFHLDPRLELDPRNVIVLCEEYPFDHHLRIGHQSNFKKENTAVVLNCLENEMMLRAKGKWRH